MIKYDIVQMKLYTPEDWQKASAKEKEEMRGKEFSIYAFNNPDQPWGIIVRKIENELHAAGIPGCLNESKLSGLTACKRVPSSDYFTYRCDKRRVPEGDEYKYYDDHFKKDIYISEEKAEKIGGEENGYNPFNFEVPKYILDVLSAMSEKSPDDSPADNASP